ncbi:MAG: hypothetical protein JNK82_12100 [Myxococcaceae bacterium]|nr:hypothetical protein [Myxococcaceae bacterium]
MAITAELVARVQPSALVLSLDGGVFRDDAGSAVSTLTLIDAGVYRAVGTFPAVDGPRQVFAAFPDAGLFTSMVTMVDVTPPSPVIEVSPPPARVNSTDGGLVTLDVDAPNAYRRDENVTVTFDFPQNDVATIAVDLFSDGGGLQPVGSASGVCASRFDGGVCRQQVVDLWRHPMHAYRDVVGVLARVTDDLGNSAAVDGGRAKVTRFKWSRGNIYAPSLTRGGDLIVFTGESGAPQLARFGHDGTQLWSQPAVGNGSHVTMGSQPDERAYASSVVSNIRISARATNTAIPTQTFAPLFPLLDGFEQTSQPVLVTRPNDEIAYFPTAGAFFNCNCSFVHGWRLSNQASVTVDAGELPGYTLKTAVTDNENLWVPFMTLGGGFESDIVVLSLGAGGFPPTLTTRARVVGGVESAAIFKQGVVYLAGHTDSDGGVLYAMSGATVTSPWVHLPMNRPTVLIGTDAIFASDQRTCRLPIGSTTPTCVDLMQFSSSPILGAAPAAGAAPVLYDVNSSGLVAIDSATLSVVWQAPVSVRPRSIDCSRTDGGQPRPGVPGVLYGASAEGLSALIVDSPGIDGTARWPMPTHDPRNTGNSTVPLTNFYCP